MREFSSAPTDDQEELVIKEVSFKIDGVEFHAEIKTDAGSILGWSDMAASTSPEADLESQDGVAFVARFFRQVMDDAEFRRMKAHMLKHKTDPDVLAEIMQYLEEEMTEAAASVAGRPTMPSSGSSDGRTAKDERQSLIGSLAEDGEVVIVPRPNRQQRRAADRQQERLVGGRR
jgi:hypothetical protein